MYVQHFNIDTFSVESVVLSGPTIPELSVCIDTSIVRLMSWKCITGACEVADDTKPTVLVNYFFPTITPVPEATNKPLVTHFVYFEVLLQRTEGHTSVPASRYILCVALFGSTRMFQG